MSKWLKFIKFYIFYTLKYGYCQSLAQGRFHPIQEHNDFKFDHNIALINTNRNKYNNINFIEPFNKNFKDFNVRPISSSTDEPKHQDKRRFPFEHGAPLSNYPLPPWAVEFIGDNKPKEEYVPRHYTQKEILKEIGKFNEQTRKQSETKHVDESKTVKFKSYGFKFKQIQPIRYHNGKAYTFYYIHSLHTDIIPVLLNSLRRVSKRNLGSGRITALRIPGMENEFCSVVGMREDFFDLARNLTGIIFRNVPETATFDNPIIGRLRIKGPIISVAGHIQLNNNINNKDIIGSSSGTKDDNKIDIINKNHYICTLSPESYLTMDVKIEYISNYVITEHGPDSLNRDITDDGFIHFPSYCYPVQIFAFNGERRGINENNTSEIVTLELHTDGSMTPRLALLKSSSILLHWFERTLKALKSNYSYDYFAIESAKRAITKAELVHPELHKNVPWNPYLTPKDRVSQRQLWYYRKDVRRQYSIDPDSPLAKQEQLAEWQDTLDQQILFEKRASQICHDDGTPRKPMFDDPDDPKEKEQRLKEINPPSWVFKDPTGPGYYSQKYVTDFDNDDQIPIGPTNDEFH